MQELCQRDIENYIKMFNERQYERNRKNIRNIKETVDELEASVRKSLIEEEEDD